MLTLIEEDLQCLDKVQNESEACTLGDIATISYHKLVVYDGMMDHLGKLSDKLY